MKKIAFTLIFAFAVASAFAQNAASTTSKSQVAKTDAISLEQRAKDVTDSMAKHLNLRPDQVKKVGVINLTNMQHLQHAIARHKDDREKLAAQVDMINETRLSQIKDVLSPEQFAKYQQRREEKLGVPKEMQSNPAARQQGTYNNEN